MRKDPLATSRTLFHPLARLPDMSFSIAGFHFSSAAIILTSMAFTPPTMFKPTKLFHQRRRGRAHAERLPNNSLNTGVQKRHPNTEKHPNQSVLVVTFDDYVYLAPYVEEPDYYFLKTVIPSRKATRDYLSRSNPDEKT